MIRSTLVLALVLLAGSLPARAAPPAGPAADAAAVVTAFNAAISARNLEKAVAHLAPGGVQFSLKPAHTGMGGGQVGLTTDLRAHWSMIGPVLFSATKSYSRDVAILDARAEGEVATVWTVTRTTTARADGAAPRTDEFREIYLLVRTEGTWRIGAVADARAPSDVGIGSGKP